METLGLLAMPIFILTSGVVGMRLLVLSFRTREIPELAMGLSFVLSGFIGLGLSVAPTFFPNLSPILSMAASYMGLILGSAGYAALATFTWRVFRSASGAALLGYLACISTLILGGVLRIALSDPGGETGIHAGHWIHTLACLAIYGWAASESAHYGLKLRRRAAIGLASPLLARRMMYWTLTTGTVFLIFLRQAWFLAFPGAPREADFIVIATLGLLSAGTTWLAFFPPRSAAPASAST